MGLKRLEINGYRSIAHMDIDAGQIVTLIGENGSGKSNILFALNYFYKNIPWLDEVSIGHALISDALYLGLERTIQEYKNCLR